MPLIKPRKLFYALLIGAVFGYASALFYESAADPSVHTPIRTFDFFSWISTPGALISILLTGNPHTEPQWISVPGNVVFYSAVSYFILAVIDKLLRGSAKS